jgi:predicted nucleic acid-binding protein
VSLFVDSSAWFAAVNLKDQHHARATAILSSRTDLGTSDFVLVETWLLIRNRITFGVAEEFWAGLRRGVAKLLPTTSEDLVRAWAIGKEYPDQSFSLVDRSSFALMQRLGITRVVSFDDDFMIYRYGPGRGRAFEVLR